MRYATIDEVIGNWAYQHSLRLVSSWAAEETRCVYVSSVIGECFQIWIDAPKDGRTIVYAACIEGRAENEPPLEWMTENAHLKQTLENAFQAILRLMAPAERFWSMH